MNIKIPKQSDRIIDILTEHGYAAYIVGGCVRDAILGRSPGDWDICTSASPEQASGILLENDFKVINTGLKHGTITALTSDGSYEITTFRQDGFYSDHRRPDSVSFTDMLSEDLSRRDFTVNAMAYNHSDGLIDMFGGVDDLSAGVVRAVGEASARFNEDALRILRALRFAAVLDFDIEEQTAVAIHTCKDLLKHISLERINCELTLLLVGLKSAAHIIPFLDVFIAIMPELQCLEAINKVAAPLPPVGSSPSSATTSWPEYPHDDRGDTPLHSSFPSYGKRYSLYDRKSRGEELWSLTLSAIAASPPDIIVRLAILLFSICEAVSLAGSEAELWCPNSETEDAALPSPPFYGMKSDASSRNKKSANLARGILKALLFDNHTVDSVSELVGHCDETVTPDAILIKQLLRRLGVDQFKRLLEIQYACEQNVASVFTEPEMIASSLLNYLNTEPEMITSSRLSRLEYDQVISIFNKIISQNQCYSLKDLALDGKDLLSAGMSAGPQIGETLERLLDAVIEQKVDNTREDLLAYIVFHTSLSYFF